MTVTKTIQVINKLGLHARAAAKLVKLTAQFSSAIQFTRVDNGKQADAKSIMEVMMLAAAQDCELTLVVRGQDAERAANEVSALFADYFGEGE